MRSTEGGSDQAERGVISSGQGGDQVIQPSGDPHPAGQGQTIAPGSPGLTGVLIAWDALLMVSRGSKRQQLGLEHSADRTVPSRSALGHHLPQCGQTEGMCLDLLLAWARVLMTI